MDPGADVIQVRQSAAARLRRAGQAIRKFLGPREKAACGASNRPAVPPYCVWYGRAALCLYVPAPFPHSSRHGEDVRETVRVLDPRPGPGLDDAAAGQLEKRHRAT